MRRNGFVENVDKGEGLKVDERESYRWDISGGHNGQKRRREGERLGEW